MCNSSQMFTLFTLILLSLFFTSVTVSADTNANAAITAPSPTVSKTTIKKPNGHQPEGEANYLYSTEDAFPVKEYRGPSEPEETPLRPNFIYGANNGHRVVEFYAPWCPHCQHFRDHYVTFAKQITELAHESGTQVDIYAVSCTAHLPLCRDIGVKGYPKILLFRAGAVNSTAEANYWQLHPFRVLSDLDVHLEQPKLVLAPERIGGSVSLSLPAAGATITKLRHPLTITRTKQQVFDDAMLSLIFNLKTGIFMSNTALTNTTQEVFRDWLSMLQIALPPTWSVQALLKDLMQNFDTVVLSEENLLKVVNQHPTDLKTWSSACTHGSTTAGTGYTCGLWQLFHILTVGVVEWNLMIATDDNTEMFMSTELTARTIRNFIEQFFACDYCRTNFLAAYDACEFDRCNRLSDTYTTGVAEAKSSNEALAEWVQLPVWMFETHNAVNLRLLKEKAERDHWVPTKQDELNSQWPSRRECPKCWHDDEGGFTDTTIYKFLRTEYWPEDFITAEYRNELLVKPVSVGNSPVLSLPIWLICLVPMAITLGMCSSWYFRKMELRRSGRHKKQDTFYQQPTTI